MREIAEEQEMSRAFGEAIRKRRERLGIRQERFAFQIDVDRTYLSGLERGIRNPSLYTVRRLARGLKISMAALVRDVERIFEQNIERRGTK